MVDAGAPADAGWAVYRDDAIVASFPGTPTTTEQDVPTIAGPIHFKMTLYESGPIALLVSISAVPYPAPADMALDSGRDTMLATVHAQLVSETPMQRFGLPGREFRYTTPNAIRGQDAWGRAQMFYDGKRARAIQLIVVGTRETLDSAVAESFLRSVSLLP